MSNIGSFEYQGAPGQFQLIKGSIKTLTLNAEVQIEENFAASDNPDAPTHEVKVSSNGDWISVGSAWERKIKRGPNEGDSFLSAVIDDPSFERPLNFAVFKDNGFAKAVFRRRQDRD